MNRVEGGAALAVTLVLLAGLGTLALTAAAAAVAALAVAGHQQSSLLAFEAAEAGVTRALDLAARSRSAGAIPPAPHPDESGAPARFEARIAEAAMPGALPAGFSVGDHAGAFAAHHYFIVADGSAGRGTRVRIEQGFLLVGPGEGP